VGQESPNDQGFAEEDKCESCAWALLRHDKEAGDRVRAKSIRLAEITPVHALLFQESEILPMSRKSKSFSLTATAPLKLLGVCRSLEVLELSSSLLGASCHSTILLPRGSPFTCDSSYFSHREVPLEVVRRKLFFHHFDADLDIFPVYHARSVLLQQQLLGIARLPFICPDVSPNNTESLQTWQPS
jgi:hypothetical protein